MPTVYIPVEVSEEEFVALYTKAMFSDKPVTESNPPWANPQTAQTAPSFPQNPPAPQTAPAPADPWTGQPTAPVAPVASPAPTVQQVAPTPTATSATATQPVCAHGPMRYVPAGVSRTSGAAYGAFWGCPQPRTAVDKCRSVKA